LKKSRKQANARSPAGLKEGLKDLCLFRMDRGVAIAHGARPFNMAGGQAGIAE